MLHGASARTDVCAVFGPLGWSARVTVWLVRACEARGGAGAGRALEGRAGRDTAADDSGALSLRRGPVRTRTRFHETVLSPEPYNLTRSGGEGATVRARDLRTGRHVA